MSFCFRIAICHDITALISLQYISIYVKYPTGLSVSDIINNTHEFLSFLNVTCHAVIGYSGYKSYVAL